MKDLVGLKGAFSNWDQTIDKPLETPKYPEYQGVPYWNFELAPGKCLVFLGDALDSDGSNRAYTFRTIATLVHLKETYDNRVVLILGNRDVNKMRLTSEMV